MDAPDMIDVLHFFFEEDFRFVSQEDSISRDELRMRMYKEMYDVDYAYSLNRDLGDNESMQLDSPPVSDESLEMDVINPFNPREREVKPFVQSTTLNDDQFNPFGSLLDDPLI
jgi:hypothetical protein